MKLIFSAALIFFSIQAIFPYFSYLENNIIAQKFFFFCISNCLLLCCQRNIYLSQATFRSCHFLNRQPAEWNPLWASGGDRGYRPLPSSSVVLMVFWVRCEALLELCFEVLLDPFTICLFIHFTLPLHFIFFFFFSFC